MALLTDAHFVLLSTVYSKTSQKVKKIITGKHSKEGREGEMLSLFCFCQTRRSSVLALPPAALVAEGESDRSAQGAQPVLMHTRRQKVKSTSRSTSVPRPELHVLQPAKRGVLNQAATPKAFLPGSQMPLKTGTKICTVSLENEHWPGPRRGAQPHRAGMAGGEGTGDCCLPTGLRHPVLLP